MVVAGAAEDDFGAFGDFAGTGVCPFEHIVAEVGEGLAGPVAAGVVGGVGPDPCADGAPVAVFKEYGLFAFGHCGLDGFFGLNAVAAYVVAATAAVGLFSPGFFGHGLVGPLGPGLVDGCGAVEVLTVFAHLAGSFGLVSVEDIYAEVTLA